MGQPGFFDLDERYESLSKCGDPLEVLGREIPWERFRYPIRKALTKPRKSSAGRKAFDVVLMFKVLVLQSLYNLSDAQTEFHDPGPPLLHALFGAGPGRPGAG